MSESKLASFEYYRTAEGVVYHGHALDVLRSMPDESIHCTISSPPYWGLRDYGLPPMIWDAVEGCTHEWSLDDSKHTRSNPGGEGINRKRGFDDLREIQHGFCQLCGCWRGCLGLEPTLELFISHIVEIFREVRRILRSDGTLWLNLGDSYAGSHGTGGNPGDKQYTQQGSRSVSSRPEVPVGLKPKDLCGIPWRVALALQAAGWWLRSAMPWVKRSAMPESVTDRPASALEYMFLLTKSSKYFFDMDAIRKESIDGYRINPNKNPRTGRKAQSSGAWRGCGDRKEPVERNVNFTDTSYDKNHNRNFRNTDLFFESLKEPHGMIFCGDEMVGLDVNPQAMKESHFATFAQKLIEPCILAGTSAKGCCVGCGAPWERVVEKKPSTMNIRVRDNKKGIIDKKSGVGGNYKASQQEIDSYGKEQGGESKTIGWQAGCKCNADTVPCVIMDPFFGSGTVGIVAHKHGRKFIGIELLETYLKEIAIPRIQKETRQLRLFN